MDRYRPDRFQEKFFAPSDAQVNLQCAMLISSAIQRLVVEWAKGPAVCLDANEPKTSRSIKQITGLHPCGFKYVLMDRCHVRFPQQFCQAESSQQVIQFYDLLLQLLSTTTWTIENLCSIWLWSTHSHFTAIEAANVVFFCHVRYVYVWRHRLE